MPSISIRKKFTAESLHVALNPGQEKNEGGKQQLQGCLKWL